ncbi:hypothetical protein [Streptosporangium sp. G12]
MSDPRFSDDLLTRGYRQHHDNAAKQLRLALAEVQKRAAALTADLDEGTDTGTLAGDSRRLVQYAGEVASFAAALEMTRKLSFLLPTDTEET